MKRIDKHGLRKGYTTGACAAAAAKAAVTVLLSQKEVSGITISLPAGQKVLFNIHRCVFTGDSAECSVIKDAGDDPDVTNGIEIMARVTKTSKDGNESIVVKGGEGVGRVTKAGLPVKIGMSAINPVPESMIKGSVGEILKEYSEYNKDFAYNVTIAAPEGMEVAKRTLNRRLGIIDGLSILGTTGIVEPMSLAAYRAVIETCLNIVIAANIDEIVFTPGRTSQKAARKYLSFLEDAFIQMGDHVGYSLELAVKKGFEKINIAGQLGKISKIANGHFDTHAYKSHVNFREAAKWAAELGYTKKDTDCILRSNTMTQTAEYMMELNNKGKDFFTAVCERVCCSVHKFLGVGIAVRCILISPKGGVLADVKHSSATKPLRHKGKEY